MSVFPRMLTYSLKDYIVMHEFSKTLEFHSKLMRETQLAVKLKHSLIRTLYHILSMWHRHEFFQWSNRHKLRCNGSKERVTRPSLIKGRGRYTVGPQAQTTPTHSLIPLITHPIEKTAAPPPTFLCAQTHCMSRKSPHCGVGVATSIFPIFVQH